MNKNEIEEKDLRLVRKIRQIVEQKEKRTVRKKRFWAAPGFWLPALLVGLAGLGLIAFRQPSTTMTARVSEPPPAQTAADAAAPPVPTPSPGDAQATPAEAQAAPAAAVGPLPDASSPAGTGDVSAPPSDSPTSDDPPEPSEPAAAGTDEQPPTTVATLAQAAAIDTPNPSADIQITHLVACSKVRGKQFVSAKSTFSLAADPKVMIWMRVLSVAPPYKLTHVYYLDGKHYCDVPLEISYPHMRTWSKVTLVNANQIGRWRVEVVDETGKILGKVAFDVAS